MRIDDMDDYTVNLADAYAKEEYRKGYEKGLKRGKSIGSHQAYNHFMKYYFLEGHWEDEVNLRNEIKHGHWVLKNSIGSAVCSVCGGVIYNAYDKSVNKFCHVCGAKMDGDNNA